MSASHLLIGVSQDDVLELRGCQCAVGITGLEELDEAVIEAVIIAKDEGNRMPPA